MSATGSRPSYEPLVLVVDDDLTTRMLAEAALRGAGFAVAEATDGEQALELAARLRPDMLLLDVEMPRLNGFETCRRLRKLPEHRNTPVLMLTGHEDSASIDTAYAAGATDFAVKPVNWTILRHRVAYMLRGAEVVQELARAQQVAALGSWTLSGDRMRWSDELYRLLGLVPRPGPVGLADMLARVHPQDREQVREWVEAATRGAADQSLAHRLLSVEDEVRHGHHQLALVTDVSGQVTRVTGTLQDVTERRQSAERIHRLAYFDGLTSLPNRESFRELLVMSMAQAERHRRSLALLYLDIDNFKRVNDTLGHGIGDRLLARVAQRLRESVRGGDPVGCGRGEPREPSAARLGGDEFAVLLTDLGTAEQAAAVAQRIIDAVSRPFQFDDIEVLATTSVGIAVYPRDGEAPEELLRHADLAMYSAKSEGKNTYRYFENDMNRRAQRRMILDQHMRRALERDEFSLVYQPQMNLASGVVDGAEALLRWNNAELGAVTPVEFIPLAEENGLILSIGQWVLETACTQARQWREINPDFCRMAVNISMLQFVQPDFVASVAECLRRTGLDPHALELEITESLLARDVDGAVATLNQLKQLGVTLSIDDFGTGYSSLSHLKHFPIDRLKIDRSFVRDITSDANDAAITSAIIAMAASMGLKVIAEGVETDDQLTFLRHRACDEIQGYLLSPPLPAEQAFEQFTAQPRFRSHA